MIPPTRLVMNIYIYKLDCTAVWTNTEYYEKIFFHVCDDEFQVLKEKFELSDLFYLAHIYLSMLAQNGSVRFAK